MRRIAITGGHGMFGSRVVDCVAKRGYEVVILDRLAGTGLFRGRADISAVIVDLSDYEAVKRAMEGCSAVIHAAAIPNALKHPPHVVFANNAVSTYNVLEAAASHGMDRAVIASSESAYGIPWAHKPLSPMYVPIDEMHPLMPEDGYGLSKALSEWAGQSFHRRTGMQAVSLRLSSILDDEGYRYFHSALANPQELRRVLWSYVDIRDAAEACALSLACDGLGCVSINICADDTFNDRPSEELLRLYFPDVSDIRRYYENYEAFYSNKRAKELLGWRPKYGWRDEVRRLNQADYERRDGKRN